MNGDWDYDLLQEVGRVKASMWFWMFQIIVVLVLQNIMLAILMDAYNRVKCPPETPSVMFQFKNQIRRAMQFRQGKRVRLNDIWDALKRDYLNDGGSEEEMLTSAMRIYPKGVVKQVRNIHIEQATRTLTQSQRDYDTANDPPLCTEDMQGNTKRLRSKADNSVLAASYVNTKLESYESAEDELNVDNVSKSESFMGKTETTKAGIINEARSAARREQVLKDAQDKFQRCLEAVRRHAQSRTEDLSHAIGGVLGDEMASLERRQKEQIKSMEQLQASLQSLQALALKVNKTCKEVSSLSEVAFEDSANIILPDDMGVEAYDQAMLLDAPTVVNNRWPGF